jgi:mannosyltransferase
MKRPFFWLSVSFLLALLLRLVVLNTRSITYDDAFSILLSEKSVAAIISGTAADTMPPLYYVLLHFWMKFGHELWFLRLLSVIFSMAGMALIYLIALRCFTRETGIWATFYMAISPFQIYHAQELRMYSLLQICLLGYILFFILSLQQSGKKCMPLIVWIGMILCGVAAMYTHNLAVFTLVVPGIYLLIRRLWKMLSYYLLTLGLIGVLCLPWLAIVPAQIDKIQKAFWTPVPGFLEVVQAIIMFSSNLPLEGWRLQGVVFFGLEIFIIIWFEIWRKRKSNSSISLLVLLVLFPPTILFIISYLMRPIFVTRGFITSTALFYVLSAWVSAQSFHTRKAVFYLIVTPFILSSVITLPYQFTYNKFPRSEYKMAMDTLRLELHPGDKIIHDNKLSLFPSLYFAPDLAQSFIADKPGSHNDTYAPPSQSSIEIFPEPDIATAAKDSKRIYFIAFSKAIEEYKEMNQPQHPSIDWLNSTYHQSGHKFFGDLEVYQFEK